MTHAPPNSPLSQTQEIDPPEDYPAKFTTYVNANTIFQKLIYLQAKLEFILNRLDALQKKTQEIHSEVCLEEEMEDEETDEDDEETSPSKKRKL